MCPFFAVQVVPGLTVKLRRTLFALSGSLVFEAQSVAAAVATSIRALGWTPFQAKG